MYKNPLFSCRNGIRITFSMCVFLCLFVCSVYGSTHLRSFGNSITKGQGLSDSTNRFSALLANYLNVSDLNGAVSGMTLVNNNFYEEEAIKDGIYLTHLLHAANDPEDFALIMFGTNDLRMIDPWDQDLNQAYVQQYREYLQLIVDSLLNLGFNNRKIFLLSDPYTQADEAGRDSVESITQAVALQYNTLHLNVRKAIQEKDITDTHWRSNYTDDTIHPNAAGHEIIFEALKKAYIEQTTGCTVYEFESSITHDMQGQHNGSIDISVMGGEGPFSYEWSNGATSEDLASLAAGNYEVTVTDSKNCKTSASFEIKNLTMDEPGDECGAEYKIPVIKQPEDYEKIVYINPEYTGTESGTYAEPYNSWEDINIEENTAYLIKSGTTLSSQLSINANNNYIGKYGKGSRPIIPQFLYVDGENLVIDSIHIQSYGNSQWQKVVDLAGVKFVTISNSYITGLVGSYDYPYYLVRGTGEHITFYNNIMSGAKEDGLYIGSSPYFTFVRNWLYNTNMGGINEPYGGDGIQLEYDSYYHAYIAGNLIDRSNTMSKFCLIINAEELTHNVVCEWNTFIAPKNGNGGAAVRWLGGANNKFNKNLIITYLEEDTASHKISGIATYDVSANQEAPYGIRDNHFLGLGNMFYGLSNYDDTNLGFDSKEEYQTYLAENNLARYGSDIDTNDFWNLASCAETDPEEPDALNPNINEYFTIYPNPANAVLHIKSHEVSEADFNVNIVDMSGKKVQAKALGLSPGEVATIDIGDIEPGLYIIEIRNLNTKIVKFRQLIVF